MTAYHITDDNRRLRCTSPGKGCRYAQAPHFTDVAVADKFLAFKKEMETALSPHGLTSKNPAINQALNSPLSYSGPKPKWWEKFRSDVANDEDLGCEPELIDVIDSSVGKLAVVWQENITGVKPSVDWSSQIKGGYGLKYLTLRRMDTGEKVGYLKLGYRSPKTFERSFGKDELTPFRYQREKGSAYHDDDDLERDLGTVTPEEREAIDRRLWVSSYQASRSYHQLDDGSYVAYYNVNASHVPEDYARVKADLAIFAKQQRKVMREDLLAGAMPVVDYSNMDTDTGSGDLRGQGLGTAMYVYAARRIAKQNLAIQASGIQTPDAQATWVRFNTNFPEQVKSHRYRWRGKAKQTQLLDFR